jgi:hypothetical protein
VETPYAQAGGLDEERTQILISALRRWAERVREPDEPMLGFPDGEFLSARQLVVEVEERTRRGRQFLHSVELVLTEVLFETYIASIERSGRPRWRVLQVVLEHASMLLRGSRTQQDRVGQR